MGVEKPDKWTVYHNQWHDFGWLLSFHAYWRTVFLQLSLQFSNILHTVRSVSGEVSTDKDATELTLLILLVKVTLQCLRCTMFQSMYLVWQYKETNTGCVVVFLGSSSGPQCNFHCPNTGQTSPLPCHSNWTACCIWNRTKSAWSIGSVSLAQLDPSDWFPQRM